MKYVITLTTDNYHRDLIIGRGRGKRKVLETASWGTTVVYDDNGGEGWPTLHEVREALWRLISQQVMSDTSNRVVDVDEDGDEAIYEDAGGGKYEPVMYRGDDCYENNIYRYGTERIWDDED